MKPFTKLTGLVVPMDRANVDTDQIIPKQFLKSVGRTGFQDNLFDAWRYLDEGTYGQNQNERRINPGFVLNKARFQNAKILLARENFGCGSSREHAVWALAEYGIRCLIAPSFADIFYNNCFKNGILPIVLDKEIINSLFEKTHQHEGFSLDIDLAKQSIELSDRTTLSFAISASYKQCLLSGMDEIGLTLVHADAIRAHEQERRKQAPWIFAGFDLS